MKPPATRGRRGAGDRTAAHGAQFMGVRGSRNRGVPGRSGHSGAPSLHDELPLRPPLQVCVVVSICVFPPAGFEQERLGSLPPRRRPCKRARLRGGSSGRVRERGCWRCDDGRGLAGDRAWDRQRHRCSDVCHGGGRRFTRRVARQQHPGETAHRGDRHHAGDPDPRLCADRWRGAGRAAQDRLRMQVGHRAARTLGIGLAQGIEDVGHARGLSVGWRFRVPQPGWTGVVRPCRGRDSTA